jgi:tetratricopeptide (TPR) repeat protein
MLKKYAAFVVGLLLMGVLMSCQTESKPSVDGDKLREYAGALVNRALFKDAIKVYNDYLDDYKVDVTEQANVNYIIGDLYFERLNDYESALAYFLKVKHLYPESSLIDETNKKIVACLERLERSEDAQQALDEAVQLDPKDVQQKRPGAVVARINKREITQGDLDFQISKLPPSVRDQFRTTEQKLNFLREYVATELLFDTAQRAGFDKDPEVIEGAYQAKKSLMVQKLLADRVAAKAKIEADDIELYYEANKDNYAEKDEEGNVVREKSLQEVQQDVAQDLTRKKYMDAYQAMIEKMLLTEDVQFFDSKVQ